MLKKIIAIYHNAQGMALVSVMSLMTLFFLMGTASLLNTATESKISQNHKHGIHAFYDCEGGIAEAIAHIKNNTINLSQDADPNWQSAADSALFRYQYYAAYDPNTKIYTITSEGKNPTQTANRRIIAEVRRIFFTGDIKSPVYCGSGKNKGQPNAIYGDSNCPGWASDGDPNNDDNVACISTPNSYEDDEWPLELDPNQLYTSVTPSVEYDTPELNLVDMADYFKNLPPDLTELDTASTDPIGSPSSTKVVYINGNQTIANITGYGILVVTGNLHITGQLNWQGVIIVLGNNVIQSGGGVNGMQVTGAILTPNNFEIRGNSDVQWCGDVVRKVMDDAGDPLTIVSWKED